MAGRIDDLCLFALGVELARRRRLSLLIQRCELSALPIDLTAACRADPSSQQARHLPAPGWPGQTDPAIGTYHETERFSEQHCRAERDTGKQHHGYPCVHGSYSARRDSKRHVAKRLENRFPPNKLVPLAARGQNPLAAARKI